MMDVPYGLAASDDAGRVRVYGSMVDLLACGGLEYSGGFVEAAGNRVHYLDYGEGEPVVLLHGGGAGGAMWFSQIAALKESHRVLAPDHPTFGLSSQPSIETSLESFAAEYLCGFLDALGIERAHVAGLSLGGFIALSAALARPERLGRLALIDSAGLGPHLPWVSRLMTRYIPEFILSRPPKFLFDHAFASLMVYRSGGTGYEELKRYALEVLRSGGHAGAIRSSLPLFADLRGQRRIFSDAELARVTAPTMIVWGENDRFFPASHARRAHSAMRGSSLEILPEAGHVSTFDRPGTINRILRDFFSAAGAG